MIFIGVILLLAIGSLDFLIDLITTGQLSFSIFYLLPILLVTWYSDRKSGIEISMFGALVWHVSGIISGYIHSDHLLYYWNTAVRLGFFMITVIILSKLKETLEARTKFIFLLQSTLDDLKRTRVELEKRAQELERSNADLEQFAFVAAHDLRSPLITIGGYINRLRREYGGSLDDKANEMISLAFKNVIWMESLIKSLLSYARIEAKGKKFEPTDMKEVVESVLANLQGTIKDRNAKITCDDLVTVMADKAQIIQLIQNLIENSIKFCDKECPEIHLSVKRDEGECVFSVNDNGIGLDAEHFDKIFGIFKRVNEKSEYSGTGIGLAVSRKIVERHGGRIWVESEKGKGSTFFFTISEFVPAKFDT